MSMHRKMFEDENFMIDQDGIARHDPRDKSLNQKMPSLKL